MEIPLNYIIDKIYTYGIQPKFKKQQNVYNFGCPVCREGKSLHKKKRGYFLVSKNCICCHNCQRSWTPIEWIKEVGNLTFNEILKESSLYDDSIEEIIQRREIKETKKNNPYTLPYDCINLSDKIQTQYFKENNSVQLALKYLEQRQLINAINRPKAFYISLNDSLHRNRLVIPFYNEQNKIIFYQSRALTERDEKFSRYLSKVNSDFTVYGINNIDTDFEYIFLFEGPIDAMFVKNGVAMGGLSLNSTQEAQLEKYKLHQRIWVLDNQLTNGEVVRKYRRLIEQGEKIFIYPDKFKDFKDLNEICVAYRLHQVSPKFFIDNTQTGMQALLKLKI